uniref:Uncharacterized protein n=1 Tax=Otus sunia TaxID=257818 RepID=A0A8C8BME3_9STRI
MPTPGGIDVTHSSKGCLHPACHLFQEHLEVGYFLLIDDNTAPREERVPVAIHHHALHRRLRDAPGLPATGQGPAELPRGAGGRETRGRRRAPNSQQGRPGRGGQGEVELP